jgi:tetratricopeptide (TPR) repeat protein
MTIDQAFNLALQRAQSRQFAEAELLYTQVLAAQPGHFGANANLGLMLLSVGRLNDAVGFLRRAIAVRPNDFITLQNLGIALCQLNARDEAIEHLRRATVLQPNDAKAHYNLGVALWHADVEQKAIDQLRHAVKLNPNYAEAHNNLGVALWRCGTVEETIECYRRALEVQPGFVPAIAHMAEAMGNLGRFEEAAVFYERLSALRRSPNKGKQIPTKAARPHKIFIITSIRNGSIDLLPYWLDYYSKFNPDLLLIGIFDDVSPDVQGELDRLSGRWQFRTFRQKWKGTEELEQEEQRRAACLAAGADDHSWVTYTDLDEFHEYPLEPRRLIDAAESQDIAAIYGWLLDRVAQDGSFPPIPLICGSGSLSLWNAFPLGCRMSGRLLRAPTRKVMMARFDVPVGSGHHAAGNLLPHPIPHGRLEQYVVHHFKWHKAAIARLEWGLANAGCNPEWQRESKRFMNWLAQCNGKMRLDDPDLGGVRVC